MRRPAVTTLALLLAGCGPMKMTATRALFAERKSYGQAEVGFDAQVLGVRGDMDAGPGERRLAVDVRVEPGGRGYLPARLQTYGGAAEEGAVTGTLVLSAESRRRRWPEDFVGAQAARTAMAMRVQDASYFRDGSLRADLVLTGRVDVDAVLVEHRAAVPEVSPEERRAWEVHNLPEPLRPLRQALGQHPWGSLLGLSWDGAARLDPIAWLGPDGRLVPHATLAACLDPFAAGAPPMGAPDPDGCTLLVRVVTDAGSVRHMRIPLPLLREGVDLMLWRQDGVVRWTRREVWMGALRAEPGATAAWSAPSVALAQTRFVYGWDEVWERDQIMRKIAQVVFAPVAIAVDTLAATSPLIQGLVELVVGEDTQFTPPRTRR